MWCAGMGPSMAARILLIVSSISEVATNENETRYAMLYDVGHFYIISILNNLDLPPESRGLFSMTCISSPDFFAKFIKRL